VAYLGIVLLHFHGDPEEIIKLFGDIFHLCVFIPEIVVLDVTRRATIVDCF
jgi:hypothetical protein